MFSADALNASISLKEVLPNKKVDVNTLFYIFFKIKKTAPIKSGL